MPNSTSSACAGRRHDRTCRGGAPGGGGGAPPGGGGGGGGRHRGTPWEGGVSGTAGTWGWPAPCSGRATDECVVVKGGRLRGERLHEASAGRSSSWAIGEARGHCPLHNHVRHNTRSGAGIPARVVGKRDWLRPCRCRAERLVSVPGSAASDCGITIGGAQRLSWSLHCPAGSELAHGVTLRVREAYAASTERTWTSGTSRRRRTGHLRARAERTLPAGVPRTKRTGHLRRRGADSKGLEALRLRCSGAAARWRRRPGGRPGRRSGRGRWPGRPRTRRRPRPGRSRWRGG